MNVKPWLVGEVEAVAELYRATGRLAFIHPRKGTVSLNGCKELPYLEALKRMRDAVDPSR